jgi:hypothetical protein
MTITSPLRWHLTQLIDEQERYESERQQEAVDSFNHALALKENEINQLKIELQEWKRIVGVLLRKAGGEVHFGYNDVREMDRKEGGIIRTDGQMYGSGFILRYEEKGK